jgi:serine/threonine protein phosphatase PrpC
MEDAHLTETSVNGDDSVAIFGVFDGHGGACVRLCVFIWLF